MNIFRGQIEGRQVFPYPNVLSEEQRETLQMLVDPVQKFFEVSFLSNPTNICSFSFPASFVTKCNLLKKK